MEQKSLKRLVVLILGIMILSFGIALFIKSDLGCDPYTTFNLGLSAQLNFNFSLTQIGLNVLILGGIMFFDRSFINIGTVISMFCVGPLIEGYSYFINFLLPDTYSFGFRVVLLILACTIVCFGVGLYIASNMGTGPYDILPLLIEKRKCLTYKWIRIILDVSCGILGFLMGATVGIGTLIAALCLGPGIEFFRSFTIKYILKNRSTV